MARVGTGNIGIQAFIVDVLRVLGTIDVIPHGKAHHAVEIQFQGTIDPQDTNHLGLAIIHLRGITGEEVGRLQTLEAAILLALIATSQIAPATHRHELQGHQRYIVSRGEQVR